MDLFDWAIQNDRSPAAPPQQLPCTVPAADLPHPFLRIVRVLTNHWGQERAITALDIARRADIRPDGTDGSRARQVRQLLEVHFADLPWPVVADATGFYRPDNADELSHYHANLYSRARCLHLRIANLKRLGKFAGFDYHGHCSWTAPDA